MHDSVKNTLSNRLAHGAWAMVFTKNDDIAIYCIELIIHCYNLKFLPTLVMVMIIIKLYGYKYVDQTFVGRFAIKASLFYLVIHLALQA